MDDINIIWLKVLEDLKQTFDEDTFNSVFKNTKFLKFNNNHVYILVEHEFYKTRINTIYLNSINEIGKKYFETKVNFIFVTQDEINKLENEFKTPEVAHDAYKKSNLNANFTFSNFVVGSSNKFAFQMAMQVADQLIAVGNPLFIFGNSGLGKTHLMNAIGNYVLEKDINKKVIYVKADMFVEEYTYCVSSPLEANQRMIEFNNKYRTVDLFLIDDIQMMQAASKTQEEFFKLFDYLYNKNKQIVITCDQPANNLKHFNSRLITRFSNGLSTDIQKPDINHRIEILKKKKDLMFAPEITKNLDPEALTYIANMFTDNVRELEGALRRAVSYCVAYDLELTYFNFVRALEPIVQTKDIATLNESVYDNVFDTVCDFYNIKTSDLTGKKRSYDCTLPRHITMYILKEVFNETYKKIGQIMGKRDHSTVMNACKNIKDQIKINKELKTAVDKIIDLLK